MAKATMEVEVVRYFETAPIESAEIVYRIISDKMGGAAQGKVSFAKPGKKTPF